MPKHVTVVVGVGAGLVALIGDTAALICVGYVCREFQIEAVIPQSGTVRCVARRAEADRKDLIQREMLKLR